MVFMSIIGALNLLSGAREYERLGLVWKNTCRAGLSLEMRRMVLLSLRFGEGLRRYSRHQLMV